MDLKEKTSNINRHPWELSRSQCILKLIRKQQWKRFADIGAGDMFFTRQLLDMDSGTVVYAVDSEYEEGMKSIDGIHCLNNISELPDASFDCLVLMDVLEHIADDDAFLKKLLDKLTLGGTLLITVPAMQFLFSSHDVFLNHYRRYSRKRLHALLKNNHLKIEKCHYFYTILFFLRLVSLLKDRLLPDKNQTGIGEWKFSREHITTRCIMKILNIDFLVNNVLDKCRIHLPGLSVMAICKKTEANDKYKIKS
jgi:SAM-dependent methyltransferase